MQYILNKEAMKSYVNENQETMVEDKDGKMVRILDIEYPGLEAFVKAENFNSFETNVNHKSGELPEGVLPFCNVHYTEEEKQKINEGNAVNPYENEKNIERPWQQK